MRIGLGLSLARPRRPPGGAVVAPAWLIAPGDGAAAVIAAPAAPAVPAVLSVLDGAALLEE